MFLKMCGNPASSTEPNLRIFCTQKFLSTPVPLWQSPHQLQLHLTLCFVLASQQPRLLFSPSTWRLLNIAGNYSCALRRQNQQTAQVWHDDCWHARDLGARACHPELCPWGVCVYCTEDCVVWWTELLKSSAGKGVFLTCHVFSARFFPRLPLSETSCYAMISV